MHVLAFTQYFFIVLGSVNKMFMFDKGCTFLAIFGLPGEKHENGPARALRAARQIFIHLQERQLGYCLCSTF